MHVLVTGASGMLGRVLMPALLGAGHKVRALSRRQQASAHGETWAVADIDSPGETLTAAVDGVDGIVHCASNSPTAEATDVAGTCHLLDAASEAGVAHLLYVSIVGIDVIATPYYEAKLAAERIVALLDAGPGGRTRDLAGPEVLSGAQMAHALVENFGGEAHLGGEVLDVGAVTFAQAVARVP
jgi:uncharacterized protein YbjT (DUF2867 family)